MATPWQTPARIAEQLGVDLDDLVRINKAWYLPGLVTLTLTLTLTLKLTLALTLSRTLTLTLTLALTITPTLPGLRKRSQLEPGTVLLVPEATEASSPGADVHGSLAGGSQEVPWSREGLYVGRSVWRSFGAGCGSTGKVVAYVGEGSGLTEPAMWHVEHEDGDEEDLEEGELLRAMAQHEERGSAEAGSLVAKHSVGDAGDAATVCELMRVLGVSQIQIAGECGCDQPALGRWLRGLDMQKQSIIAAGEAVMRWYELNKARACAGRDSETEDGRHRNEMLHMAVDSGCDAAHADDTSWRGEELVGARVSVRWEVADRCEWFEGTVVRFDAAASRCGAHQIEYDCDHKRHWSLLNQMEVGEVGGNAEWAVLQMPGDVMSVGSAGEAGRGLGSVETAR